MGKMKNETSQKVHETKEIRKENQVNGKNNICRQKEVGGNEKILYVFFSFFKE